MSCSGDDDSSSNDTSIDPPNWIQGRWHTQVNGVDFDSGFEFKKNDFCIVNGNYSQCYQSSIDLLSQNSNDVSVKEEISSDRYFIELTIVSQIVTYEYEKFSETFNEASNAILLLEPIKKFSNLLLGSIRVY